MTLRHFRYSALMGQIWMGLHVLGMQKRFQRHNCRRRFVMTAASGPKTRIQWPSGVGIHIPGAVFYDRDGGIV